ncbi:hypothetical protein SDC9_107134 [bioreactor metagenome]|uniref:Uncharacterized protein n=1 Tax=bioreactor metagenome TaxID=1076179 RepID=A0A645BAU6_9ZZZZ
MVIKLVSWYGITANYDIEKNGVANRKLATPFYLIKFPLIYLLHRMLHTFILQLRNLLIRRLRKCPFFIGM